MKPVLLALAVGLAVGLTVPVEPVEAEHVQEPTAPITDLHISLYEYGTRNRATCGGTFDFDRVYYDIYVVVAGLPSEHWDVRLAYEPLESINPEEADWHGWGHQNVPPHTHNDNLRYRAAHGEVDAPASGPFSWLIEVTGRESETVLAETCTIYREG